MSLLGNITSGLRSLFRREHLDGIFRSMPTADLSSYIANCAFRSQVFTCMNYGEFLLLTTSRTGVCSTWMPVGRENLYAGQDD